MIRSLAGMLCLACCMTAQAAPPALTALDVHVPAPLDASSPEGLWQMAGDGALFYISPVAGRSGRYSLILHESPDLSVPAEAGVYDASLVLNPAGSGMRKTRNFIFTFAPDGSTMTMQSYRRGHKVNMLRLLPYLFRVSVAEVDTRPENIDGAERISPPSVKYTVTL